MFHDSLSHSRESGNRFTNTPENVINNAIKPYHIKFATIKSACTKEKYNTYTDPHIYVVHSPWTGSRLLASHSHSSYLSSNPCLKPIYSRFNNRKHWILGYISGFWSLSMVFGQCWQYDSGDGTRYTTHPFLFLPCKMVPDGTDSLQYIFYKCVARIWKTTHEVYTFDSGVCNASHAIPHHELDHSTSGNGGWWALGILESESLCVIY